MADPANTRPCWQADLVIFVGNAAERAFETLPSPDLVHMAVKQSNARQELVLLHIDPEKDYAPQGTRHWIQARTSHACTQLHTTSRSMRVQIQHACVAVPVRGRH